MNILGFPPGSAVGFRTGDARYGAVFSDDQRRCTLPLGCRGRLNFDSFPMAVLSVFVVVSLDDWNALLYEALRVQRSDRGVVLAFVYFFCVVVFLRYVVISMIIAIIFDQVERDAVQVVRRNARVSVEIKMFRIRSTWSIVNGCGERDHSQTSGDLRRRHGHSVSRNEWKRPRFERARRVSRFVSPV